MKDFDETINTAIYEAAVGLFCGDVDLAAKWLNTPCLGLGSIKPIDADPEQVLALIWRLNCGCLQ